MEKCLRTVVLVVLALFLANVVLNHRTRNLATIEQESIMYTMTTFQNNSRPPKRIALCISGQFRNPEYIIWDLLLTRLVQPIRKDVDVFIMAPDLTTVEREQYSAESRRFNPVEVLFYKTDPIITRKNGNHYLHGHPVYGATGLQQAYGFSLCYDRITQHELKSGFQYEWIIRTRPDNIPLFSLPPLEDWPSLPADEKHIWAYYLGGCNLKQYEGFQEGIRGVSNRFTCMNDHYAIMTRSAFKDYFHDHFTWWETWADPTSITDDPPSWCPECLLGLVVYEAHKHSFRHHCPYSRCMAQSQLTQLGKQQNTSGTAILLGSMTNLQQQHMFDQCENDTCVNDLCGVDFGEYHVEYGKLQEHPGRSCAIFVSRARVLSF